MNLRFKKDPDLDRLDRILNFDLSESTPSVAYLTPVSTGQVWVFSSILATPVILWILAKKRKFGWLISFLIFVLTPWLSAVYFLGGGRYGFVFSTLPMLFLYVYLFLLKQTYPNWKAPVFKNTRGSNLKNSI